MFKKLALFALLFLPVFCLAGVNQYFIDKEISDTDTINVYFFYGENCPHCAHQEPWLKELDKREDVSVYLFEVSHNKDNREMFDDIASMLNTSSNYYPFTVVNNQYFVGWDNESGVGADILSAIENKGQEGLSVPDSISVPFLGDISIVNLSLPIITILFGAVDGFNPCAMWVLLFLISLLLGMKDKKRMWTLGVAFIITSALVYFLIMVSWLKVFQFFSHIPLIKMIVVLVAFIAGGYNIKEFIVNKSSGCKVTKGDKQQKIFARLKEISQEKNFAIALGGIILLALAVNIVELGCSLGLPVIYTQILAANSLSPLAYYLYIALYILIFMIDDLFVFFASMIALQATGITTKYTRWSHLIGGIIMIVVGMWLALGI